MKSYIPHPLDVARLVYEKAKKVSDELLTKARFFYQEKISDGLVTKLGHNRRFTNNLKHVGAFAFFSKTSTMMAFVVMDEIVQDAAEKTANAIKSIGEYVVQSTNQPEQTLTQSFAGHVKGTEFVSKNVYDALHKLDVVAEFNNQQNLIDLAYDPNFKGELPAELNAFREGHYGPLTCEFEAHAKLAKNGIQYIREDNQSMFIFPEKMVSDMRRQFGETNEHRSGKSHQHDASHRILVFRDCAEHVPELTQEVRSFVPSRQQHAQTLGYSEPIPAPV